MELMGGIHGAHGVTRGPMTHKMTHNEMSKEDIVYTGADVKHTANSMLFTVRHCSSMYTVQYTTIQCTMYITYTVILVIQL